MPISSRRPPSCRIAGVMPPCPNAATLAKARTILDAVACSTTRKRAWLADGVNYRASVITLQDPLHECIDDRSPAPHTEAHNAREKAAARALSEPRRRIKMRTFADWNEPLPGNTEMDLVAHCGEANRGS
jgi:hypothetical protein